MAKDEFKAGEDKGRILGALDLLNEKIQNLNDKVSNVDISVKEWKCGIGQRLEDIEKQKIQPLQESLIKFRAILKTIIIVGSILISILGGLHPKIGFLVKTLFSSGM